MFSFSVSVHRIENPKNKLLGFADLKIEDFMTVKGWKIFEGPHGNFVKPPSHLGKNKEGEDTYFDDVLFTEEKGTDEKMGAYQTEIYQAILDEFAAAGKNNRQAAAKKNAEATDRKTTPPAKKGATGVMTDAPW